ncbi:nuclease-related domain-containing protein [Clostridium sp. AL.422]|uniref:nuclease-related domain-containing protein n=1 Tax=Clostridium TaxID=1485 RepID=UPI00293DBB28|nr:MULTISPECIES: nuclease-related domain-containing protein [unclassified Clostridium]MDV4151757.1 nuclease-related domain-containing protein [Clostridium sp. AL.422]
MEYLIIIIVVLVFLNANSSKIKGNKGEKYVDSILREIPGSMVLRDIVLKSVFGTSQIDNILISPKGIFVIETKNYSGWIFGNERSKYWTQTIYNKKSKFFNPIRQNYGHIKAIESYLPYKKDICHSLIVFSNRCELKRLEVKTPIIKMRDLKSYLIYCKSDVFLTKEDINYYSMILEKNNITDKNIRKNHVQNIRNNKL